MTPESLVTTRETSLRLKELGFPQETAFEWLRYNTIWMVRTRGVYMSADEHLSAPTLAEVLEQLRKGWNRADVETWNSEMGPYCCVSVDDLARTVEVRGSNPAEAAALLWEKVNL